MKIALIEDNSDLREEINFQLTHLGHEVTAFSDGNSFLRTFSPVSDFNVLLLDLGLPDVDGLEVAQQVNTLRNDIRIIILTARNALQDRVKGWNVGAHIYLTKPVDIEELQAILDNLPANNSDYHQLQNASLILNTVDLSLTHPNGEKLGLSFIEVKILSRLNAVLAEPVSRDDLIREIGENPLHYDPRRLEALMSRLRRKCLDFGCEKNMIQAVRGKGYLLTTPIEIN